MKAPLTAPLHYPAYNPNSYQVQHTDYQQVVIHPQKLVKNWRVTGGKTSKRGPGVSLMMEMTCYLEQDQ